ncbi:tRNA uridine-5-carboxymethylaminomethyl(34) synthesis GTPase MnmE [Pseudoflavonifractor sp. 60]|uniref:tRNA uridine-5-carboxymethylaminomethyl(34) synthesis GTPase MnmE n=1 Tax=Pseudoflavonifractor sp. 60 TaxID=2304576 RepID=UPI00136B0121|nr:tRNA uridine-5-carboxymethylaminomethyl(34) synthesis GTPase MnmE [Pseudoflavonifractor sp. 60]NBI67741.1 tRNA uridine-5-carboxymethylaminomethyl(34) synthesis GTPase MnmE [Pseudoflavonifractor sp. 60]
MFPTSDTIAALSTPPGPGAIGILRLSGPSAVSIVEKCFKPLGPKALRDHGPRELVYGELLDSGGQAIDRVLCTYSLGPGSYTGEDTAELQCHGSPMVLALGLEALFAAGARQARAGEFTRRAFLNGRLDLAQAEAVGDLLEAQSRESARHAAGQLGGTLSRKISEIYSALTDVMAHFHAVLDYPDEDIDPFRMEELDEALANQEGELNALLASCGRARLLRDGVACAIVGRPNAGKSSLLNAMVGYERAIVTDIPGTTRDTVEERCELGGIPLRLIDTAGLRDTADPVEQLGVERARRAMEEAGLILVLIDASQPAQEADFALLREAMELAPAILVWTKGDLPQAPIPVVSMEMPPAVTVSARTGYLDGLCQEISCAFPQDLWWGYGEILTNARQEEAASRAREGVRRARAALKAGVTPDALLTDVEEALEALGELTGQSLREEVTDRIFQRFCVGK